MRTLMLYQNRKLYLKKECQYINYPEMLTWEKNGIVFKVIDHKTKNDVTAQTVGRAKAHAEWSKAYGRRA